VCYASFSTSSANVTTEGRSDLGFGGGAAVFMSGIFDKASLSRKYWYDKQMSFVNNLLGAEKSTSRTSAYSVVAINRDRSSKRSTSEMSSKVCQPTSMPARKWMQQRTWSTRPA